MTKLAIWSLGEHAKRNLLPAASDAEGIELVGVYSRDKDSVAETCTRYGCRGWKSADEMLADDSIDTVMLAGPNGVHFEQGQGVLQAGKHLWCEKSLTPSVAQTRQLLNSAQDRGLVVAEAFMFVYHPQFRALNELLASGELGVLRSITCRLGFPHLAPGNIRYSKPLAGGALLDAGAYCIAAPLRILNKVPVETHGYISSPDGHEVDTAGSALLVFDNDVTAQAEWGFGRSYRNEIELWCEKGFARAMRGFSKPPSLDTTIDIVLQENNAKRTIDVPGGTNHFGEMMKEFSIAAGNADCRKRLADQALRQAETIAALSPAHQ